MPNRDIRQKQIARKALADVASCYEKITFIAHAERACLFFGKSSWMLDGDGIHLDFTARTTFCVLLLLS